MKKKGFTLIELIVVIAIIGVLAAILVPAMLGYVKKSKITTCNTTAKSIYNGFNTALVDLDTSSTKSANYANAYELVSKTYFTDIASPTISDWAVKIDGSACTASAAVQGAYAGCYPNPVTVEDYDSGVKTLAKAEDKAGGSGSWNAKGGATAKPEG